MDYEQIPILVSKITKNKELSESLDNIKYYIQSGDVISGREGISSTTISFFQSNGLIIQSLREKGVYTFTSLGEMVNKELDNAKYEH